MTTEQELQDKGVDEESNRKLNEHAREHFPEMVGEEPAPPVARPIRASQGWTGQLAASIVATPNLAEDDSDVEAVFIIAIRSGQIDLDFGTSMLDRKDMEWWGKFSQVMEGLVRKLIESPAAKESLGARAVFKAHDRAAQRGEMPRPTKRLIHYATCPQATNPNAPICACDGDAAPLLVPRGSVPR
jgi:hypothetical protein